MVILETPNLYIIVLTLKDHKGNVVEARSSRIGFRKVEFKNKHELCVNGKRRVHLWSKQARS